MNRPNHQIQFTRKAIATKAGRTIICLSLNNFAGSAGSICFLI